MLCRSTPALQNKTLRRCIYNVQALCPTNCTSGFHLVAIQAIHVMAPIMVVRYTSLQTTGCNGLYGPLFGKLGSLKTDDIGA